MESLCLHGEDTRRPERPGARRKAAAVRVLSRPVLRIDARGCLPDLPGAEIAPHPLPC